VGWVKIGGLACGDVSYVLCWCSLVDVFLVIISGRGDCVLQYFVDV
jgi:hypothetical protein